jgi:ADP-L-glycero-D-manno-heptose 6-epimerase
MIALTGAGGFIGSVVLGYLNSQGINNIVLFDDLPTGEQFKNLIGKDYVSLHSAEEMFSNPDEVEYVIHIGADSSTLTRSWESLYKTNVLSTRLWNKFCNDNSIPFIFTSSAAVYGNGNGPLNHYAFSKLTSENEINGVVLRLFNVYGPNEYHKGRMASTIYHWYNQLKETGTIKLFNDSNNYRRDFIWVEDVARVINHFIKNYHPGVYDVGTGESITFENIANCVINEFGSGTKEYIPMPEDLKAQYQLDTRADTTGLLAAGFDTNQLFEPWQGIKEYFKYLKTTQTY